MSSYFLIRDFITYFINSKISRNHGSCLNSVIFASILVINATEMFTPQLESVKDEMVCMGVFRGGLWTKLPEMIPCLL